MITGRPKPTLTLSAKEHAQFCSFAGSRTLPHALVSTDPFCIEKVRDIVGLYLTFARSRFGDVRRLKKARFRPSNCTQPVLPMGLATSKA
jgi:hypothetical protein